MCGVVGTYGYELARDELEHVVDAVAHRGPDAVGVFEHRFNGRPVFLGHRRLSIIDLSAAANQPFIKGDLVLAFNGEIYNFRELRASLEREGATFITSSDTEVILEGWRAWGAALLPKLRGMFAFALYSCSTGELVLARDPFGIKPLFFAHDPATGRAAFASELKALRRLPGATFGLSETALAAVLLYDWIPEQHCMLEGVRKVPPGTFIRLSSAGAETHTYWRAEDAAETAHPPPSLDELAATLEDAVRAHMVADVEVGVMLSGGLDSSLIAALAAREHDGLRCYTIGFSASDQRHEAMPDDLVFARSLARRHGFALHEITIAPDVARLLPQMAEVLDEPIGDAAAINVMLLCGAARADGVRVMLSGMGADELFGGYRRHRACLLAAHYRALPLVPHRALSSMVARLPVATSRRGLTPVRWAKRFLGFAGLPEEEAYRRSYTYYDLGELDRMLAGRAAASLEQLRREHADVYWRSGSESGVDAQSRRMSLTDLRMFLPGLNLAYTDRASMAASVELRVPFVDLRVVESALRLRGRDRIRGGTQKLLLKRVAERYLPRDLIYRRKASFGAPLRAWTTGVLREMIFDLLPRGELVARGLVDSHALVALLRANDTHASDHAQAIWQLLTLEHWIRGYSATRDGVGGRSAMIS